MKKFKKRIIGFLVAIVLIAIIALGAAMFVGCTDFHIHTKAKEGQIKVACVGDSITYGMSVVNWFKNTYPKQLGELLGDEYHVQNFGFSAKTAQENNKESYRATKLYEKSKEYQPDIVILMLGSNDSKPENFVSKEYFKQAERELIEIYLNLESKPRLILATVNAGFYVHGATEGSYMYDINGTNINIINEAVYELAEEYNLELVDTYALTKDHPEYYKIDGIHPDKNGQKAMAEAFYQDIID
ncbi:MAG: hypothetical protein IKL86_03380 [Clostridia bacterium]|nr:hypothetical protein [Clostridia bacterium]